MTKFEAQPSITGAKRAHDFEERGIGGDEDED